MRPNLCLLCFRMCVHEQASSCTAKLVRSRLHMTQLPFRCLHLQVTFALHRDDTCFLQPSSAFFNSSVLSQLMAMLAGRQWPQERIQW